MDVRVHLGVDAGDFGARQHPPEELEGVATHVERHAAAGPIGVPEPRRVRPIVLLRLLHHVDVAQRPLVGELLEPHVLGREAELLGVHELDARSVARVDHGIGVSKVQAEGLLADDVLPRLGRRDGRFGVQVVRQSQDDKIKFVHREHVAIVREVVAYSVPVRELRDVRGSRRGGGQHPRSRHALERLSVYLRYELTTDQPYVHLRHAGTLSVGPWDEKLSPRRAGTTPRPPMRERPAIAQDWRP